MASGATERRLDAVCLAILAAGCVALFLTAPPEGYFAWSESSRNALDGAFFHDLLRDRPLHDPVGWAYAYYLKYPALTVLFYPPLLHLAIAAVYFVAGVSHAAALATVVLFAFALLAGVYAWGRRMAGPGAALAGALLLLSAPELVLWGQQVMLEVPMMALATWAVVKLLDWRDAPTAGRLAVAAMLAVAALYTKQTAGFPMLGAGVGIVLSRPELLRRRYVWLTAIVVVIALLPLAYLQIKFAAFNVVSVADRADMGAPGRFTAAGLGWYGIRLPLTAGWPLLLAGLLLPLGAVAMRWRIARADAAALVFWVVVTYVALTVIDLKQTRHGLPLLVPIAVAAGAALDRVFHARASVAAATAAGLAAAATLVWHPAIGIGGYAEAADHVAALAPPAGRVMFVGNRDGAFIFDIRAHTERGDITVVRADKIFLGIAIEAGRGLNAKQFSEAEIADKLTALGISYVVTVPHQWAREAPVMANLASVLDSPQFERMDRIPVTGGTEEHELVLYHNRASLPEKPSPLLADLPAAGLTVH